MAQKKKAASRPKKAPARKTPVKKAAKKAPAKKAGTKKAPAKKPTATKLLKGKSSAPSKNAGLPRRPGHFGPTPSTVTHPPMPIGRRKRGKQKSTVMDTCTTPPPSSPAPKKDGFKSLAGGSPTKSTITMPP